MKNVFRIFMTSLVLLIFISCKNNHNADVQNDIHQAMHQQLDDTEKYLERLYEQPNRVLNELPKKFDSNDNLISLYPEKLPKTHWRDLKVKIRNSIINKRSILKEEIAVDRRSSSGKIITDRPEAIVDNPTNMIKTLQEMENGGHLSGRSLTRPWSDSYWPLQFGATANRYADRGFRRMRSWRMAHNYFVNHPLSEYLNSDRINMLSPAEKYAALIGDDENFLAISMWEEGAYYFNKYNYVESWMGKCDGRAAASIFFPRPVKELNLKTPNGSSIRFYPSDIKALGSLLWANGNYETKFVGQRCDVKNPRKDRNGRIIDQACFENNPGTWHMAIVNQVGVSKKNLIMDSSFDYEVWNQPIFEYQYSYFNPQTKRRAQDLSTASVSIENFTRDLFSSYRSINTKKVVGISMNVWYSDGTIPFQRKFDSKKHDKIVRVTYRYDLELDEEDKIIGGEWYTNKHPDFLWLPQVAKLITSKYDQMVRGKWELEEQSLPNSWKNAAKQSAKSGLPLPRLVEQLFNRASN